jgi:hypothetical protein
VAFGEVVLIRRGQALVEVHIECVAVVAKIGQHVEIADSVRLFACSALRAFTMAMAIASRLPWSLGCLFI